MKRLNITLLTASLALFSMSACAGHRPPGYDRAKVVRSTPIYETMRYPVDEQVCWDEQVWQRHPPPAVPTVAGAVIGGVVGHEVAKNNHRRGAYPVTRTRCEIQRNWRMEQRITGWDVAYRYRGRVYHTWLPEQPGKHILVNVNVMPAPYYPPEAASGPTTARRWPGNY